MAEQIIGLQALNRRLNAIGSPQATAGLMKKLAASAVREEKLLVRRKTGNLGRSIHAQEVTESRALLVASANYAGYVEHGTPRHEITPNAKMALAFASQGIINERFGVQKTSSFRLSGSLRSSALRKFGNAAFIVVKKVHHPGTRPHPFMLPGAQKAVAGSELKDQIIIAWNEAG